MKLTLCLLALAVALANGNLLGIGRSQRVKVKGQFFCPANPEKAANVQIKMKEQDLGPDDHMAEGRTDEEGRFELEGSENEVSNLDVHLHIYHDCNDVSRFKISKPCQREWDIRVPDKYLNGETMDLGYVNLEIQMKDEDRDCIH